MTRILLLGFVVLSSIVLVGAFTPTKRETIVGTVVAYDHFNNLMMLTFVESRVVLIVRTQPRGSEKARFIQVAYNYWDQQKPNEGGFPDALVQEAKQWRFALARDTDCDQPVQEFTALQDAQTGKDTDVRLPIWKLLPGAENEKLPFGETLPCYSLKATDYKPYSK
jgi:hypothetical protein